MAQKLINVPIMGLSSGTIFSFFVNVSLKYRVVHQSDGGTYYREITFSKAKGSASGKVVYTPAYRLHGCKLGVWVDREFYPPARQFDLLLGYSSYFRKCYHFGHFLNFKQFQGFGLLRRAAVEV